MFMLMPVSLRTKLDGLEGKESKIVMHYGQELGKAFLGPCVADTHTT